MSSIKTVPRRSANPQMKKKISVKVFPVQMQLVKPIPDQVETISEYLSLPQ